MGKYKNNTSFRTWALFGHALAVLSLLGAASSVPARAGESVTRMEYPVSTSRYVSWLTGEVEVDADVARKSACEDGGSGVVLLSFGKQVEGGTRSFEDAETLFTYEYIQRIATAYAEGLAGCHEGPSTLVVATSNYRLYDTKVASEYGAAWRDMLTRLQGVDLDDVFMVGGIDLEPGWGGVAAAHAWVGAYNAGSVPLVANASADGCPTSGTSGRCANGWSVLDLAAMVWGDGQGLALPQIYRTDFVMARQWGVVAKTWVKAGGTPRFAGIMTQVRACQYVGKAECENLNLGPVEALLAMRDILGPEIQVPGATDVGWG